MGSSSYLISCGTEVPTSPARLEAVLLASVSGGMSTSAREPMVDSTASAFGRGWFTVMTVGTVVRKRLSRARVRLVGHG